MSAVLSRWLSPIVTKASATIFRAKLSDDATDDAVELAGFSTPTATELTQITDKRLDFVWHNERHSSAPRAPSDHLSVRNSSTAQHQLADGHADTTISNQGVTVKQLDSAAPIADYAASTVALVPAAGPYTLLDQLLHSHWQQATADIRLVLSVLLELADGHQPAAEQTALLLQQLVNSSNWQEACQHCRDRILCAILQHYFDSATRTDSRTNQPDVTNSETSADSSSGLDSINTSSRHIASDDSTSADSQLNTHGTAGQHFVDPLQDSWEQPASSDQPSASLSGSRAADIDNQQLLQECWLTAAAVGAALPQGCSPDSIAAAEPNDVLLLCLAVIVAGEARQQLHQSSCVEVLQQLQQLHQLQQEERQLGQLQHGWMSMQMQAAGTAASNSSHFDHSHSSHSIHLQQAEQKQLQQQKQPPDLSAMGIWPLVQVWLAFIADLSRELQQELLQVDKQPPQREQSQQQLCQEPKARGSMTGTELLGILGQLQQRRTSKAGLAVTNSASTAQQPPSEPGVQGEDNSNLDSSRSQGSTGDSSSQQLLLQQLQQWECALPLLQQRDLADQLLQDQGCPDAMQLVVLLRLLGRSSSLWLPAAEAAVTEQRLLADTQQQDMAHNDSVESPRTPRAGQQAVTDPSDDAITSPRSCWPPELLTQSQLWPGDAEEADTAVMSREERTLRCWINSLLRHSERGAGPMSRSTSAAGRRSQPGGQTALVQQSSNVSSASVVLNACDSSDLNGLDLQELAVACSDHPLAAAPDIAVPQAAPHQSAAAGRRPHKSGSSKGTTPSRAATNQASGSAGPGSSSSDVLPHSNSASAPAAASNFTFRSISSLYGAEVRSGVLLLELLEHLQPGCVDWKVANRLPFKGVGISPQLQALENCQLALRVAQEELGLPLVSMSPRDVVLGRRKIILSLVYQLMRYHTMQLLEGIAAVQQQQQNIVTNSSVRQQQFTSALSPRTSVSSSSRDGSASSSPRESPSVTPRAASVVRICSSSKKQRKGRQLGVTEGDILEWANRRLQQVQPLPVDVPVPGSSCDGSSRVDTSKRQQSVTVPYIRSFKDPALSSGVLLLQLLYAMDPAAVDLSYVVPGATPEQRESNAKYALAVADKMGCNLFLVWEDLVVVQPNMVLVLLASLMYLDQRQR